MARTRLLVLVGVILLVIGMLMLIYDRFVFERSETHSLGPLTVEIPKQEEVRLPKAVGWGAIVAGVIGLGVGLFGGGGRRKD